MLVRLVWCVLLSLSAAEFRSVRHHYGQKHAEITFPSDSSHRRMRGFETDTADGLLKVFHITDAHISLQNDDPPQTTRMYSAFVQTTDRASHSQTTSSAEFVKLLQKACAEKVDLIALGGDILNFPSERTVAWISEQLRGPGCGIPFLYTAGNHDWHVEGKEGDQSYDEQREPQLTSTLWPLFEQSAATLGRAGLFGHVHMKGVEILFIDNSNHQVSAEQLDFARERLNQESQSPVVLLLHMPLALPGVSLPPKESCGHASWGAAGDENWQLEGRPRWPQGNEASTGEFLQLVRAQASPAGRLVSILSGHVHRDFTVGVEDDRKFPPAANRTALACDPQQQGCGLRSFVAVDAEDLSGGGAGG
ncbi:unnamed protein product, partial [Polarella glacialis]